MGTGFAACVPRTLHEDDCGRALSRTRIRILPKSQGASHPQCPNEQSIPHPHARKCRRIASALRFALIAVLLACGIAAGSPPAPAFAESEVGHLLVGARIDYAGYNTTWMSVDGNAAYCATPMLATPRSGPYAKAPINAPSGRSAEAAADLWFGYGSPGFDKTLWPSTWYDGGEMTEARYAALTHILLSDTYSSSSASALYGCNESFRSWAQRQVIGFDSHGALINAAATGRRIAERTTEVPATFSAFQISTGNATQCVVSFTYTAQGSLELTKVSSQPRITEGNPLYSLEGAKFGIFRDESCSDLARTIACDAQGRAKADAIPTGTYWVRELQAPLHMATSANVYPVEVKDRQTAQVNGGKVENTPQTARLDVLLRKLDADSRSAAAQGDASLAGAVFTVRYFAQLEPPPSEGDGNVATNPLFTWEFRTDELGEVHLSDATSMERYHAGGDELPRDSMGFCALPIGVYTIEETKAPQGYEKHPGTTIVTVTATGEGEHDCAISFTSGESADQSVVVHENVLRGGIAVSKTDAELHSAATMGGNEELAWAPTLDGVLFEIVNASPNSVNVNGEWSAPGQVVGIIETQWDEERREHRAQTAADALPFGTYSIREVAASNGYLLSDGNPRTVEVHAAGELAEADANGNPLSFSNQVIRNDLELFKIEEGNNKPLQVAFSLTNLATGEKHVLVCDEDGHASTESRHARHTGSTNGNDRLLETERVAVSDMDPTAGIWFGRGSDGNAAAPNDDLAALPYGRYLLEELPCDTNEGYDLVSETIEINHGPSEPSVISRTVTNRLIEKEGDDGLEKDAEEPKEGNTPKKAAGKLAETGDRAALPTTQLLGAAALAALALVAARIRGGNQAQGGRYQRRRRRK